MTKSAFSLPCLCLLILSYATVLTKPVFALKNCDFPAIFNFGDSNSDTGALSAAFNWTPPPYGDSFFEMSPKRYSDGQLFTGDAGALAAAFNDNPPPPNVSPYFHMPAGRASDGRLIIDFMAGSFGLPFLSAYLNSLGSNFKHGANFASASATIAPPWSAIPIGSFSPFYLDVQYWQFRQFINRSQMIKKSGGIYKDLVPDKEYFRKALYTLDIGQNDLTQAFSSNMSMGEVKASIPNIINRFSINVKNIYELGARSFWIHNTGPIGCLSFILAKVPLTEPKDPHGCAERYNEIALYFNYMLKNAIVQLRKDLPLAAITHVDMYSVKYLLFSQPRKYGFEDPLVACCGFGGKYNYGGLTCGRTIIVDGKEIFVGSCKRPCSRVNWDGIHYTQAANEFVFSKISTGAYSDPPIPLRMACHKKIGISSNSAST